MKILIINSRFFLSAGPERYMFNLQKLLEDKGHTCIFFSLNNSKNHETEYQKYFIEPIGGGDKVYFAEYKKTPKTILQILERQIYSIPVYRALRKLIDATQPDIAYVLHHYNKLSPSVITACKDAGIPTVMRLSDYFMVCPESHLFRKGEVCNECINKNLLSCIEYSCVKDSRIGSIIKTTGLALHRLFRIYEKTDAVVSPTKFMISKVNTKYKLNIYHIPTFIPTPNKPKVNDKGYILFVGRVEPTKGILEYAEAIGHAEIKLKIVGKSSTGFENQVNQVVKKYPSIKYLGPKYGGELIELYKNARAIVIPTKWYENLPNVALEAMAMGKPIITAKLGAMKEVVTDMKTGILYKPNDKKDMLNKTLKLYKDKKLSAKLGRQAYETICTKHSPEEHYRKLMRLFDRTIAGKK